MSSDSLTAFVLSVVQKLILCTTDWLSSQDPSFWTRFVCYIKELENAQPYQTLKLSNSNNDEKKSGKDPTRKETQPKDDASRKFPAVTCPPGKKHDPCERLGTRVSSHSVGFLHTNVQTVTCCLCVYKDLPFLSPFD